MSLAVSLFVSISHLFIPRSLTVHLFLTHRMCFSFINAFLSFENKMVLFSSLQLKILLPPEFYDLKAYLTFSSFSVK